MKIGIIGSGMIGATLASQLVKLGHEVALANSRGVDGVAAIAKETGAKAVDVHGAVRGAELVIITIPQKAVPNLPKDLFAGVPDDVIVVETGNYYPSMRDGRIPAIDEGQPESVWVAAQLGRPVVKAFNSIMFTSLDLKRAPAGAPGRIALPVSGDPPAARKRVLELVDALGFDPVDAGPLSESWRQQPGTAVYCTDLDRAGVIAGLRDADPKATAALRAHADETSKTAIAAMEAEHGPNWPAVLKASLAAGAS